MESEPLWKKALVLLGAACLVLAMKFLEDWAIAQDAPVFPSLF